MLFNSTEYLIFLPIVLLLYFALPNKLKNFWLLAASYYFYMCWNAKYALLMLLSTAITFASGLLMEKAKHSGKDEITIIRRKKLIVAISFVSNLAILFFFKYFNFGVALLTDILARLNIELVIPRFDVLLPVGISFYTFQALSYTMDVYRDDIYAEKNFFRYALFVSFFPQLVAGPIERSKNLLKQLAVVHKFDFDNFREGILLMLWGFFLKLVIADRFAIFIDLVYGAKYMFPGCYLLLATIMFAFQIYCDFYGYSTIAMGSAKMLGINIMENFNAPYLSCSVADFWRDWHISLTSWFKDYLYIPLGGSRKGKFRKYLNIMIVFLTSGLWHGADLSYVIWGALNGMYQIAGDIFKPLRDKFVAFFHLNRASIGHKLASGLFTFALVDFAWIFFRASSISEAVAIIKSIIYVHNPWIFFDNSLMLTDNANRMVLPLTLCFAVLVFSDVCKRNGIIIRKIIMRQDFWFRWLFIAFSVAIILTFGIWGAGFSESNFIYFQF